MKYLLCAAILLFAFTGWSQNYALRDINYSYLYNPAHPFNFSLRVTRTTEGFNNFYELTWKDTTRQYVIEWEIRKSLGEEKSQPFSSDKSAEKKGEMTISGNVFVPNAASMQILVAKVVNETSKTVWIYYRILEPNYPVNALLKSDGQEVLQPYIRIDQEVSFQTDWSAVVVTYYNDDFPAAVPPFAETQARVSKKMKADSVFSFAPGESTHLSKPGLYLFQKDSSSTEALSVRVHDDYPRLSRIESLADPLIYVCSKIEFDKVKAAKGDKKAFDKSVISITGDTDRAKNFMRSYFRRVELANQYFTSYKEGWKTDRGMIYIIYGAPHEVFKFSDREVWSYKKTSYKATFTFAKSGTIFDPDNFVLIREKKYQETWYQVIDLWRNARF